MYENKDKLSHFAFVSFCQVMSFFW